MSDWTVELQGPWSAHGFLSPVSAASPLADLITNEGTTFTSASTGAWPVANTAFFFPVLVKTSVTVTGFGWFNGATVTQNVDCGIYDAGGSRLVSLGSTSQGTASTFGSATATSTPLTPALYYLAMAANGTTGLFVRSATQTAPALQATGVGQMATAFVLPATATIVATASAYVPLFGAQIQSVL